jgi:hypothetical protein
MPTARELLEQADALMRRNRARQVDTEVPELTEVVLMPVAAPSPPTALDEIPELMDAVEEIELASIVEMPDDDIEPTGWLRSERDDLGGGDAKPDATAAPPSPHVVEPIGGRVLPLFAIAGKPEETSVAIPAASSALPSAVPGDGTASADPQVATASVIELPVRDAMRTDDAAPAPVAPSGPSAEPEPVPPEAAPPPLADDWARWEALAEEIRMQVLQRIDIFTDTGLREQLSVQMQPIVDHASAELVATINEQVGKLLRAYIAEAIEREIEKWRMGNT